MGAQEASPAGITPCCGVRECKRIALLWTGREVAACLRKESVAGTKNDSQGERNRRICLLRRNGFTFSEIAQMEDLSRVRVAQIVARAQRRARRG